jgi:hypothetical protein
MDNEPVPAFLLRWARTAAQPTPDTRRSWSAAAPVWIALGITAILVVATVSGYRLNISFSTHRAGAASGLPSPEDQPPPTEAPAPPLAAASSPVAAPDPSPTVVSSIPPTTEQVTQPAEAPPIAIEKPAAALPGSDVFVVRFDSKLPVLTPSGIRALDAALRAAHAGRKVQIAIEGCDSGDRAPNRVDCADRVRQLKGFLADNGVHHPAELIANATTPPR